MILLFLIKQSDIILNLIKEIDEADLLNINIDILRKSYKYLVEQIVLKTGK